MRYLGLRRPSDGNRKADFDSSCLKSLKQKTKLESRCFISALTLSRTLALTLAPSLSLALPALALVLWQYLRQDATSSRFPFKTFYVPGLSGPGSGWCAFDRYLLLRNIKATVDSRQLQT